RRGVAGGEGIPPAVVAFLQASHEYTTRVVVICTEVFRPADRRVVIGQRPLDGGDVHGQGTPPAARRIAAGPTTAPPPPDRSGPRDVVSPAHDVGDAVRVPFVADGRTPTGRNHLPRLPPGSPSGRPGRGGHPQPRAFGDRAGERTGMAPPAGPLRGLRAAL